MPIRHEEIYTEKKMCEFEDVVILKSDIAHGFNHGRRSSKYSALQMHNKDTHRRQECREVQGFNSQPTYL
jgi:hypothetical protein